MTSDPESIVFVLRFRRAEMDKIHWQRQTSLGRSRRSGESGDEDSSLFARVFQKLPENFEMELIFAAPSQPSQPSQGSVTPSSFLGEMVDGSGGSGGGGGGDDEERFRSRSLAPAFSPVSALQDTPQDDTATAGAEKKTSSEDK